MSIDPEMLMAYADGELDPISAKRVERAIVDDPALGEQVARHRALRALIAGDFAPIADEPIPDRLTALLATNVVTMPARRQPRPLLSRWREAAALAACLVIGVMLGRGVETGPVTTHDGALYASGSLATALDRQVGSDKGAIRIAVTFRDGQGQYCRVFGSTETDGIACRDGAGWALRETRQGSAAASTAYVQAASADAALLATAQDMMAGAPLDAGAERAARDSGWR